MAYRLSMFKWKISCAWCDVKTAFSYLLSDGEKDNGFIGGGTANIEGWDGL